MSTPKPSNLQLDALAKEIKRLRTHVEGVFERLHPCPSWEEEREWNELNPSPRRQHAQAVHDFREAVSQRLGHDLELRVRLGQVKPDEIYDALQKLTAECTELCKRLEVSNK